MAKTGASAKDGAKSKRQGRRKGSSGVFKGAKISLVDAVDVLGWTLQDGEYYEVPCDFKSGSSSKHVCLRMRKANRTTRPKKKSSK